MHQTTPPTSPPTKNSEQNKIIRTKKLTLQLVPAKEQYKTTHPKDQQKTQAKNN
jgi:hypothetical protein